MAYLIARGTRVERAKEIAHDAWATLLQNQQRGVIRELKLPALVLQQAAFLSVDDARRARHEPVPAELADAPDLAPGIDDIIASRERLVRARSAFALCSKAEQRIFNMLYERPELTCREVAVALGLSEQRVKQVAYEVRKRLRAALEEDAT